ncbi:MAG: ATP-binding protein [Kofleriaceae bacterium]
MSIRTRLLLAFVAIVVVVTALTLALLDRTVGRDLEDNLDDRLRHQALGVLRWLDSAGHPERLAPRLGGVVNARVTIVDADGVVIGDSDRPGDVGHAVGAAHEIRAARSQTVGRAVRVLDGDAAPSYLVAVRAADGRVLRLAVPMTRVATTRHRLRVRLALASLVGLAVALALGLVAIRTIVRPLRAMTAAAGRAARGDYAIGPASTSRDELGVLSRALVGLADEVQAQIGALTHERDLSLAVIGAMVEGVVVVDPAGAVVLSNPAAAALGAAVTVPAPLASSLAAARAGYAIDGELALAGRTVRCVARGLPGGRGAVAVLHDVSRLRALETARRAVLADAAHELRTPITAIAGFAETLAEADLDDATRREFVATIGRNADRIARLVASLLELEHLDERLEAIDLDARVELAPVVAACVATARAAHPDAPSVAQAIEPGLAVRGDRDRLEQIIQNLVDNAFLHGAPPITIAARRAGDRVELRVADAGGGVPPELRERVFERFYRGPTARRGEGSGLGLPIARAAATALDGTLAIVEDEAGVAGFVLTLPAASAAR